jgi:hypothetical protein
VHGAQIGCRTALAVALLLGSAAAGPAVQSQDAMPQDRTTQLRARFDRESDPVRKAKLMPQLGEEQFKSIREKVRVGQVPEALPTLDQYRAEAKDSENALVNSGINAEKHPNGFKELEISLRESLRRLNEMLPTMTTEEQQPFVDARKELNEMDQRLVHELFPQRP